MKSRLEEEPTQDAKQWSVGVERNQETEGILEAKCPILLLSQVTRGCRIKFGSNGF